MIEQQNAELIRRYISTGMQFVKQQLSNQQIEYTKNIDWVTKQIQIQAQQQRVKDYNDLLNLMQRIICGEYYDKCPKLGAEVKYLLEQQTKQDFTNYTIEDVPPSEQQPSQIMKTTDSISSTMLGQN